MQSADCPEPGRALTSLRDQRRDHRCRRNRLPRETTRSQLALTLEAALAAIADAGLAPTDIDGLIPYAGGGVVAEDFITNFGLRDVTYSALTPLGGASPVAALQSAALAVASGVARHVLLTLGRGSIAGGRITRRLAEMPQMHVVGEFEMPLGCNAPAQFYAHMARRHMALYGTTQDQFAEVALTCRRHAQLNERAMMRKPMTREDYWNSRLIADPFRLFDCSLESAGAAAVVVSSAAAARDLRPRPVWIGGVAESGFTERDYQRPDLTTFGLARRAACLRHGRRRPRRHRRRRIYDCFTWVVLCQPRGPRLLRQGRRRRLRRERPYRARRRTALEHPRRPAVEAHIAGMNHIIELVRQLRGDCGARQVAQAESAWSRDSVTWAMAPSPSCIDDRVQRHLAATSAATGEPGDRALLGGLARAPPAPAALYRCHRPSLPASAVRGVPCLRTRLGGSERARDGAQLEYQPPRFRTDLQADLPYTLVTVDLAEGVRLLARLAAGDPARCAWASR